MWSKFNDKSQKILFDAMWSNAFKRKANYEMKTKRTQIFLMKDECKRDVKKTLRMQSLFQNTL